MGCFESIGLRRIAVDDELALTLAFIKKGRAREARPFSLVVAYRYRIRSITRRTSRVVGSTS